MCSGVQHVLYLIPIFIITLNYIFFFKFYLYRRVRVSVVLGVRICIREKLEKEFVCVVVGVAAALIKGLIKMQIVDCF